MSSFLIVSFESHDPSDITLASLYWRFDHEGRWLYTVSQIADHMSIPTHEVPKRIAVVGPGYLLSHRCESCFLPFRLRNRSEYAVANRDGQTICQDCREAMVQKLRNEEAQSTRARLRLQEAIWLHNTSIDHEVDYSSLEYSDIVRAFALFTGSEADVDANLRFSQIPQFSARADAFQEFLKTLYGEGVLLIGKGTPLDAFVPGDSVDSFRYYPARVVWRFATPEAAYSSVGQELARCVDNPESDFELWNSVAEIWWQEGYAESVRYLNEQLGKYGLKANEGDALRQAINHALDNFSIPQVRNLLWKIAKDIGAFSAERGVSRPHAINAVPGKLTRTIDRYLANDWSVTPYVLRWDDEESLLTTTLFDRVLKTGVAGFKGLSGRQIQEHRLKALDAEEVDPAQSSVPLE